MQTQAITQQVPSTGGPVETTAVGAPASGQVTAQVRSFGSHVPPANVNTQQSVVRPATVIAQAPEAVRPSTLRVAAGERPVANQSASSVAAAIAATKQACVLPAQMSFKGEATFTADAVIEGNFEGVVRVGKEGKVTIGKDCEFKGEIHANSIRVDGKVDGELYAKGGLASFGPTSACAGTIHYTRLAIEEGALIEASMKRTEALA